MDTIAAIATPLVPEQGSVAIVRLSGPAAQTIAQQIFVPPKPITWESHRIYYGYVADQGQVIDEVLLLWMQGPRSFTREDVVELHCHGGVVLVQAVLALCLAQGARLARPGEFTLRAFLNGRLDLTQAESVAELVASRSPQAAQLALAGLQGKLAQPIQHCRRQLLSLLAEIEARLDFEEDLPTLDYPAITAELAAIQGTIASLLATAPQGELLRAGIQLTIVGRPNVGKSSLLNAWSQRERALVTDLPGTTRDLVDLQLIVRGMPVLVLDTAGIRATSERVEQLGIERSWQAIMQADLVLLVLEAQLGWTAEDAAIYQKIVEQRPKLPLVLVVNKIDLNPFPLLPNLSLPMVQLSARTGVGIPQLEECLWQQVSGGLTSSNVELAINQRQQAALIRAHSSLQRLTETKIQGLPRDFWSIDLRAAILALSEITGDEVTESLLDVIFSRFCMGK